MKKNIVVATGYTHGGIFHADDVFSVALLRILNPEFKVTRGFNPPMDDDTTIVFDIGGSIYDHHERKEDKEYRENGVPYAAFGKLWRDIAPEYFGESVYRKVDTLVQEIDAVDNGVEGATSNISRLIHSFNPLWNETVKADEQFEKAVSLAKELLQREIDSAKSEVEAAEAVKTALNNRISKEVLILNKYLPWLNYVQNEEELLYVVFPSLRGGWNVQVVPKPGTRIAKYDVPESWKGYDIKKSGNTAPLYGMEFCHATGFISQWHDKSSAIGAALWLCHKERKIIEAYYEWYLYENDPCSGWDYCYTNYPTEAQCIEELIRNGYEYHDKGWWIIPNDPYNNYCSYKVVEVQ